MASIVKNSKIALASAIHGRKPLIVRETVKSYGWNTETLENTVRVRMGKLTVYFSRDKQVNVFENRVYRLISKVGTRDYIIRPTR